MKCKWGIWFLVANANTHLPRPNASPRRREEKIMETATPTNHTYPPIGIVANLYTHCWHGMGRRNAPRGETRRDDGKNRLVTSAKRSQEHQNDRVVRRWSTVMQNIQSHTRLVGQQRLLLQLLLLLSTTGCNDMTKPNKRRRRSTLVQYFAHWLVDLL